MMEQRTDDWFAARLGKVTASRVADVIAKTKSGYGAGRANYLADLVVERLTGQKAQGFSNAAMEWGTQTEPQARAAYSAKTGILVEEVGFIDHPTVAMSGASPDGFAEEGLIEVKCPNTSTMLEFILDGKPPQKYVTQMQWQMACTGRPWCDFVSFDPRLPERLQLLVVRVPRDDAYIAMLETEVKKFLAELDDNLNKLEKVSL
jgi:putative phage-type endonuclease